MNEHLITLTKILALPFKLLIIGLVLIFNLFIFSFVLIISSLILALGAVVAGAEFLIERVKN